MGWYIVDLLITDLSGEQYIQKEVCAFSSATLERMSKREFEYLVAIKLKVKNVELLLMEEVESTDNSTKLSKM